MRVLGLLGLVLALVIVGLAAKKQFASTTAVVPALPTAGGEAPADARTQSRQVQQQVKDALDAAAKAQASRMPDEN